MQGLVQLYNGLSAQIHSTQSNLNLLYRRMDVVERALVERFLLLDPPTTTPRNTPHATPNTAPNTIHPRRYVDEPYSHIIEPSIITQSGNRHVMSFATSPHDDNTNTSSDIPQTLSTNTSRHIDNMNMKIFPF